MRPIYVTVGPSLASSSNDIATSQTPAGTSAKIAATFTASSASIAATNSFIAGQQVQFLNIGGSANAGSAGAVGLPPQFTPGNNYFVLSTGLSGSHFEVSATFGGSAITPSTAGTGLNYVVPAANVALNGTLVNSMGVAVLPAAQRVLITTSDTTTTFTLIGASSTGALVTETLINTGSSVQSQLDYATLSAIMVSQQPTAALTVGTNGVGSTPWVRLDEWANTQVSIQLNVTGTVNYTVQSSMDGAENTYVAQNAIWINTNDTNVVSATTSLQTNYAFAPIWVRCLLNSGSGSVKMIVAQSNVANR